MDVQTQPQTAESLSERLNSAYKRIPRNLRGKAVAEFCRAHGIAESTFTGKRTGDERYSLTEMEVKWLEDYNPYEHA